MISTSEGSGLAAGVRRAPGAYVALALGVWFLVALGGGLAGWFDAARTEPPLGVLLAIALPPLSFAVAYRSSRKFREFVLGADLRLITAVQAWRVIGGSFLVLYGFGMLPALFAYPAAIGDLAVGMAAPFLAWRMMSGAPGWQRQLVAFNVFGLLDFVVAVGTGVLTNKSSFGLLAEPRSAQFVDLSTLPLSLVPDVLRAALCHSARGGVVAARAGASHEELQWLVCAPRRRGGLRA